MQSNEEEGEKGIFETLPKIQEEEVVGDCLELIKEEMLVTTIPSEVEFYDTGQVTTLTINLAKCNSSSISPWCSKDVPPKTFEVVFILEFLLEHKGKPPPRVSILFYTNISSGGKTLKKALLGRQPMQSTKEDLESNPFPDLRP